MEKVTEESTRVFAQYDVSDREAFSRSIGEHARVKDGSAHLEHAILSADEKRVVIIWSIKDSIEDVIEKSPFRGAILKEQWRVYVPDAPPSITRVVPWISQIVPGGNVVVEGDHFGAHPGELLLHGAFPSGKMNLTITAWGSHFASGVVPSITGVMDQDVEVQIVDAKGRGSQLVQVAFRAERDIRQIPRECIKKIHFAKRSWQSLYGVDSAPNPTITGRHAPGIGGLPSAGRDAYDCELANGWTFHSYAWLEADGIDGGPFGNFPDPVGASKFTVYVKWFFDFMSSANYRLNVYAIGPLGVSMV
jgi:hypothetical protein